MTNLPVRMARWSAHHPWRAIAAWFLFVMVCLGAGISVGGHAATSADYRVGEAGRAEAMAEQGGMQRRPLERVLITGDFQKATAAAQDVSARMKGLAEVESVAPPVRSADGKSLRVDVTLKGPELEGKKHVDPLLAQTAVVQKAHPDLRIDESGSPSISKDVQGQRGEDLSRTEMIALPVTLIVLLLVFRSLVMAFVPVLLAVTSIASAIGLSMLASHLVPDAGVGANVILLIGMAVGVDYTLFYLKREREERGRSGGALSPAAVVELAAATSGRAVVVSGLAVAVSSATLYLADDVIFASLATGAIVVTLAAVISSLTILPALLTKLGGRRRESRREGRRESSREGRRVGRPGARRRDDKAHSTKAGRLTTALMRTTSKRPAVTLAVAVVALLAMAAPLLGMKLTDVGRETYSRDLPAMQAYDRVNAAFPELKANNQIVVRADASQADQVKAALNDLAARTHNDKLFAGKPELRVSPDGRISRLEVGVPYAANTDQAHASLDHVRDRYVPETVGKIQGAEVAVTGEVARYTDYPEHQSKRIPMILGTLLLVTFAITVWAFRSVMLGAIGALLNLLSAAASLGLLTVVFQGTWAEGLLGFTSMGSIGSRVPLFLFVILFGLSMDYQVFVLSRIREAVDEGVPTRQAVLEGIGASAGVVTSAALVMVTVFASFIPLHLIEMKQFGFALGVAVLLDAFIIRLVILPAALLMLGERTWWPWPGSRGDRPGSGHGHGRGTEITDGPGRSFQNVG
ncbi:MMPL family transporter [Actinomadura barringtoniae]|uniref:MMPL family transporter n=1 Tax=Actinomadura barringtoniae TaxID=1427535 RepID=A0A939P7S5_9ACTN|nr:MMPL family transporter [Actinomadura barringtoniae]MBO2447245.1 MMPL family transporter [Actinomadura barringtoniae]